MRVEKVRIPFFIAVVVAGVAIGLPIRPAFADDTKTVHRVEDLNRAAMEDYDLLEFESAKKQLAEALTLAKKGKLDKNPVTAKTHVNLGIVYGGGLNDNDSALLEFKSALDADPNAKLPAAYKTPTLTKLFDQAKSSAEASTPVASVPAGPTETGPPDEQVSAPAAPSIKVTAVDDAQGGNDIPVVAKLGPEVKARQVILYYQAAGSSNFTAVPMKSGPEGYQANIPAKATNGDSVHYYVEAKTGSGKVLAAVGSGSSPSTISLTQAKVATGGETTAPPEEENPLGEGKKGPDKPGNVDAGAIGGEPPPDNGSGGDNTEPPPVKSKKVWLGFEVGTGGGLVTGNTEVSHQSVSCCLAFAPVDIVIELGFYLKPKLTLSVYARLGFPLGANVEGAATAAPAGFLRLGYFTGKDATGVFVHGDIGGGFIRDIITLKKSSATAAQGDTDTYASGPLFLGGGVGWMKPLAGPLRFVIDLNVNAGIPVISSIGSGAAPVKPGFAINADLNLGLQLAF